eukprot:gene13013-14351_t
MVVKLTRNQLKSKIWIEHRKERLTASKHHEYYTKIDTISHARGQLHPKTTPLVSKVIYRDENFDQIAAVKLGRENEENALKQFYAHEAGKHIDFKLLPAGLFLDRHRAYIGASPYAIMHCKCLGQSTVKIKCSFNIQDDKIREIQKKCVFLKTDESNSIYLNENHKYYTQVVSQIILSNS